MDFQIEIESLMRDKHCLKASGFANVISGGPPGSSGSRIALEASDRLKMSDARTTDAYFPIENENTTSVVSANLIGRSKAAMGNLRQNTADLPEDVRNEVLAARRRILQREQITAAEFMSKMVDAMFSKLGKGPIVKPGDVE